MRFAPLFARVRLVAASVLLLALVVPATLQAQEIDIVSDDTGRWLSVDGEPFMVLGMNWDYFPRGTTNPAYNFWGQSDEFIRNALDREMSLLRTMGVNSIRLYQGIQPRWVEYIYDNYGIMSILNHTLGRYGLDYMGGYIPNTDYSDPDQRQVILDQVEAMVREFEGTRGVLMWLLGNENNYGLVWSSAETENLPQGEADAVRARYMYNLFGEATELIQSIDPDRPVAMANGDLGYIDIIVEEVPTLDIMGSNVYRGRTARDFFQVIEDKMGILAVFTEFGADRFDAQRMTEDQETQASYLLDQWQEIYEQSAGKGRVGNSIGGMTFQWTDGWWKFGQTDRLDIQDTNASWANDAYPEDFVEGTNNMNEEWWGIVAKGETDAYGYYDLYPRAAFYALKDAYELDPYGPNVDLQRIREHFGMITAQEAAVQALGATAAIKAEGGQRAFLAGLRMDFETYSTGGSNISTPENSPDNPDEFPAFQGFDQKQSFWADFGARPAPNIEASLSVNVLGAVPTNPIDEIFYENRGRPVELEGADGATIVQNDLERVAVYSAGLSWDDRDFQLDAFYRTGHYHWGYEGDMFGIYREANYGPNLDIYNGIAPIGFEFTGKRALEGLSVAAGPQLWWGANPMAMAKYTRSIFGAQVTGLIQEEFKRSDVVTSSFAVPQPENRRASLVVETEYNGVGIELGGLWAGSKLEGRTFQLLDEAETGVLQDEVKPEDTFGGRARLTVQRGGFNWYAQGALMGLVADGGPTQIQT
ncbi:MAG: glycosidase, partial [Gemmatimonadetes bacterium]|nr:glycosidase [Gemmatimonadota bacterium]